ncbi:hypothetical protein F5888DRAFT_1118232 [Russula emetica]|nr:hypothetical protein F5888DRAFT_1118232 [Russula emetica]
MGFRIPITHIPITLMFDLPRLCARYPIITASEYLRLRGQDPENESSSGFWMRDFYISSPNIFEPNQTKLPSQFIIQNHWYDPSGTDRVDYIPEAMKSRGKWERYPESEIYDHENAGYWPPEDPTDISDLLTSVLPEGNRFGLGCCQNCLKRVHGGTGSGSHREHPEKFNTIFWIFFYLYPVSSYDSKVQCHLLEFRRNMLSQ